MFGRKAKASAEAPVEDRRSDSDRTLTESGPSNAQVKRATRTRNTWSLIASFLLLISVVFLILVEIGNINNKPVIRSTWFIRLDLSQVVPLSVPNAQLISSIAQTLGLKDDYYVGLWSYSGRNTGGVSEFPKPQALYWFNPVEVITSSLLSGASIALPAEINDYLDLLRLASHWMFGLFLAGVCLNFVLIFLIPLAVYSRWAALPLAILTFLGALFTTVASILGTVIFIILSKVFNSVEQLNIQATIGVQMYAFMWIASGASIIAWLILMGECCCCASRRDVKKGKKRGSKKAWETETAGVSEKPARGRFMGRGRK
ncbi:hypothetical protein LTR95_012356 [Oleoguttula sp. CCFEE 5521]